MTTLRRTFLKEIGLATAAITIASPLEAKEGNDPIPIGFIGPGGMGTNHLKLLTKRKDIRIDYVCEVDANRLATAAKLVETEMGKAPKTTKDMREILDDKQIQAVWMATPDHWHAPGTILACNAGKHVYVEKPCCHNIREGRLMTEAARKNKVIVQTGTQSRSTKHVMEAMQKLQEGAIGEILVSKAWNSQLRRNIGHVKPTPVPEYLDYDLWTGSAEMVPYQANMLPGSWRWFYGFGAGDMGNDGVHDLDIARWGLGVEVHPTRIAALGGKYFFDDDQQFPDTQYVLFEYAANGKAGKTKQLIYEHRIWSPYIQEGFENGNAFYGTKGMLILGKGGGWKLYAERNKLVAEGKGSPDLAAHHQNFIDCIRSGKLPNADVEIGHLSAALCHLGNIAVRVGRQLMFDPKTETIVNDPEANALVKRKYRDHWATPKGV
jgi:predicted dehydrogenase